MRRARTYGSSCSQVVIVYTHPFRRSSLLGSRKLQKIIKTSILWFKVIQSHQY